MQPPWCLAGGITLPPVSLLAPAVTWACPLPFLCHHICACSPRHQGSASCPMSCRTSRRLTFWWTDVLPRHVPAVTAPALPQGAAPSLTASGAPLVPADTPALPLFPVHQLQEVSRLAPQLAICMAALLDKKLGLESCKRFCLSWL